MNKSKLWLVTELFPPDETSTSYILGEIANAFCNKYQVKVICGPEVYDKRKKYDPNNSFKLDPSIELFRAEGADLDKNTTKGKALSFILMSSRLMRLAKKHIGSGDKVLMVTNPAPLVLLMSRLKKRRGFELNLLVHDVFPENTKPAGLKLPMYTFFKKVFDKAYSKPDQLIAIGRDMAEVIQRKAPLARVTIIENWADIENIKPHAMPEGKIRLEYAGNIGRVQALDEVIAKLPSDVELHIYGTGSMEEALKRLEHPNVFFHGPYFRSQQNEVLANCHIALVTLEIGMYGLGVPSKTYNILAAGRPVLFLGPEGSEIDRLVKEERVGYSEWPNVWKLDELVEMGNRARALAERNYSKETILHKFVKAI